MQQTGFQRTSFTRHRRGADSLAITPAWLHVRHVRPGADESAGWAARIRVRSDWDVRIGDVLAEAAGRLFVVQQIAPEQATVLLLCSELKGLIPDDFAAQTINDWWTVAASGLWAVVEGEACVRVTPPVTARPSTGAQLTQSVTGDFDIAARIKAATGEALNGQYALLGAQVGTNGVWIGACGIGTPWVLRVDESANAVNMTMLPLAAQFFRIVRVGADFLTYYSDLVNGPTTKADWKLLRPQVETALGSDLAAVGSAAMAMDAGQMNTIYWVKNEWPR